MIGGTGAVNTMIYMRGNPNDYDEWERLGNKGWSYKDCLPYFEKLDKLMSPEFARHSTLLKDAFLKAGKMMGYPVLDRQLLGQVSNSKTYISNTQITMPLLAINQIILDFYHSLGKFCTLSIQHKRRKKMDNFSSLFTPRYQRTSKSSCCSTFSCLQVKNKIIEYYFSISQSLT